MCAQTRPRSISHPKYVLENGVRTHANSKGKNPLYRKKNSPQRRIDPTTLHQAGQRAQHTTNQRASPAPTAHLDRRNYSSTMLCQSILTPGQLVQSLSVQCQTTDRAASTVRTTKSPERPERETDPDHPLQRKTFVLLVGCLSSQQHASVSQGRICSDNFTCCHTEIEVADQTFHLTQSQYTDTGPTSPSVDPITPGAWQGSHWSANFEVTGMT